MTGTSFTDYGRVQVDATKTLNLSGVGLSGGLISNYGTIDITGDSSISGDQMGNAQLTIDSGKKLTLNGTTITGGTITDNGTIDVTGSSTINSGISLVGGQLKVESSTTLTLNTALAIGSNSVTLVGTDSVLDDLAGLSLAGGTISGSGNLSANTNLSGYGTVSIPLNSADTVTANGGTLEFTNAVDSNAATSFDIASAVNSILKFDGAVGTASINPIVTFDGGDDGHGVLDLTSISLSNFHGVIANFDEGESIDIAGATSALLEANGTSLDIYNQATLLGTLALSTSFAGDTFNVLNGAITIHDLAATLDSTTAVQGAPIYVVSVIDDHTDASGSATYAWQVFNGTSWVAANGR